MEKLDHGANRRFPRPEAFASRRDISVDEFPSLPQSTSRSIKNTTTPPVQIPWPTLSGYEKTRLALQWVGWKSGFPYNRTTSRHQQH